MNDASTQMRDYYSGIETDGLNARHRVLLATYRQHRARLGRPVSVLDIGCGRGAVLSSGIDAEDAYAACDIVAPRAEVPLFRTVDLNSGGLSSAFDGSRFDVLFCSEVLEHVFSPDGLLDDLQSLMHGDSLLILSTPNLAYWLNRVLLLAGISPLFLENSSRQKLGRRLRVLGQGHGTEGHIRVFTHRAVIDLIGKQDRLELRGVRSVPVWDNPIDRIVCRVSPKLSPDNVYELGVKPG